MYFVISAGPTVLLQKLHTFCIHNRYLYTTVSSAVNTFMITEMTTVWCLDRVAVITATCSYIYVAYNGDLRGCYPSTYSRYVCYTIFRIDEPTTQLPLALILSIMHLSVPLMLNTVSWGSCHAVLICSTTKHLQWAYKKVCTLLAICMQHLHSYGSLPCSWFIPH